MKKLFFAASIASLALFSTSCKKETTCECKTYEIEEDGSKTHQDTYEKVVESKDADCSQFNKGDSGLFGSTVTECEEKVLD